MCRKEVIGPAMLVIGLLYIAVSALLVLTSFGLAGNDEATTALDPKTEKNILSTLRNLSDKGITIVAVSHQSAVLDVADQAYRLNNGEFKRVYRNT